MNTELKPTRPHSKKLTAIITALVIITITIACIFVAMYSQSTLIFSEDFEDPDRNQQYLTRHAFTIEQNRLRIKIEASFSGCDVALPNQFDDFTFITSLFPVGDTADGSANLLFRYSDSGWYEIQFRPNQKQVNVIKVIKEGEEENRRLLTEGWVDIPKITFKPTANELKLTANGNTFTLWFNGEQILALADTDEVIHTQGTINVGAGAGETGGIAYEYDNIRVWKP